MNAYVDDIRVRVSPDSGSALNLISEAYVRQTNMKITDGTIEPIQLPNGRTTKSSGSLNALFRFEDEQDASRINFIILAGCIYDFVLSVPFLKLEEVEVIADSMSRARVPHGWDYGSNSSHHDPFICDFYVVSDLTAPVILSSTMLYGTNAFNTCDQYIMQSSNVVNSAQEIGAEVAVVNKRWPFSSKNRRRNDEPAPCKHMHPL